MVTVTKPNEGFGDTKHLSAMKGASERVVDRCNRIMINGEEKPLDDAMKKKITAAIENLAERGERVLAFAYNKLDAGTYNDSFAYNTQKPNWPLDGYCLAGLVALQDPPRLEVPLAVYKCQSAGIKVVMVTGDFPKTAAAIARQVNIISSTDPDCKDQWEIMKEFNIDNELDALQHPKCTASVISGDKIYDMQQKEEKEEMPEKERGKPLLSWLTKQ